MVFFFPNCYKSPKEIPSILKKKKSHMQFKSMLFKWSTHKIWRRWGEGFGEVHNEQQDFNSEISQVSKMFSLPLFWVYAWRDMHMRRGTCREAERKDQVEGVPWRRGGKQEIIDGPKSQGKWPGCQRSTTELHRARNLWCHWSPPSTCQIWELKHVHRGNAWAAGLRSRAAPVTALRPFNLTVWRRGRKDLDEERHGSAHEQHSWPTWFSKTVRKWRWASVCPCRCSSDVGACTGLSVG